MSTSTIIGPAKTVIKMTKEIFAPCSFSIFDGGCIDSQGMLWWACNAAYKVLRINPDTGKIIMTLKLDFHPTSVAFGGPGYKTLFVTSIGMGMPGADKPPSGGVAMIMFDDQSICGLPPAKCVDL
jgi:sugar lactone lactonase YvrE